MGAAKVLFFYFHFSHHLLLYIFYLWMMGEKIKRRKNFAGHLFLSLSVAQDWPMVTDVWARKGKVQEIGLLIRHNAVRTISLSWRIQS